MTDRISLPPKTGEKRRPTQILRDQPQLITVPAVFVVVVLAWEFGTQLVAIPEFLLPRPSVIVIALIDQLGNPVFWGHLGITLQEAGIGFAVGAVVALVLGTLVARSQLFEKTLMPYVVAFQSVPKVALA